MICYPPLSKVGGIYPNNIWYTYITMHVVTMQHVFSIFQKFWSKCFIISGKYWRQYCVVEDLNLLKTHMIARNHLFEICYKIWSERFRIASKSLKDSLFQGVINGHEQMSVRTFSLVNKGLIHKKSSLKRFLRFWSFFFRIPEWNISFLYFWQSIHFYLYN